MYALAQKMMPDIRGLLALHPPAGRWRLHDAGGTVPHGERCKLV
ncbi:putative formate dehydrogenase formation protein [Escherichia coli 2788150]|nr:putative formate dehydrogenase formation protein [Escherichia coli 2788150]